MREALRASADRFLDATYGFDAAARTGIIDRAAREILGNCRELLEQSRHGSLEAARRCAHRLKGNLTALGLAEFAAQARDIEALAGTGQEDAVTAAAESLYCRLTALPLD